ncbi:MAG: molybdopterin-dependent oxidoreductase, partial [Aestuariibacter sp.]|nr:molybdopterin-dependent oxidoreductase [Aestuariibacter sp.]
MIFSLLLRALPPALKFYALRSPKLEALMAAKDFVAQIKIKDGSAGRWYRFSGGKIESESGIYAEADVIIQFKTPQIGQRVLIYLCSGMFHFAYPLLRPFIEPMAVINAAKNFAFEVKGEDDLTLHFTDMLNALITVNWKQGTKIDGGETRYVNQTNGGPVFVYVKDGKIQRITPMDFDASDAPGWSIQARGKTFTPPHRSTISPHGLASKSMIYSNKRLLYPMKRVDFDPNGERNPQNRGKSGYQRISWDEALEITAN